MINVYTGTGRKELENLPILENKTCCFTRCTTKESAHKMDDEDILPNWRMLLIYSPWYLFVIIYFENTKD